MSRRGFGLRVAVLIDPRRLAESLVLARLLEEVEQGFGGEVIGVVTEEGLLECLSDIRKHCCDLVFVVLDKGMSAKDDVHSIHRAINLRADVVALPATLNDLLDLFLRGLVYRGEIIKPKVHVRYGEVEFLSPMHRILRTDILAYALITGVFRSVGCLDYFNEPDTLGRFVSQLSLEHPELLYRFLYSAIKPRA